MFWHTGLEVLIVEISHFQKQMTLMSLSLNSSDDCNINAEW